MIKKLLVFGASIVYGSWDEKGGWAGHLRRYLDRQMNVAEFDSQHLFNLGVSGATTKDLLNRIEVEASARFKPDRTNIIISVGTNDSIWLKKENRNMVSASEYINNLKELVSIAKKYSDKLVFIGSIPVDESRVTPLFFDENIYLYNKYVEQYDRITKDFCEKENIPFLNLFDGFIKEKYQDFLIDGLHPNTKGHKKMFKLIKQFLIENKVI